MLITLEQIVKDLLAEQGHYTTHDYLRLLHIANRGLRELTFDVLGKTKVTILEVNSSMKIDLPSDYVDYEFVGVVNEDYRLEPLGMQRRIPLTGDVNDNTEFDDSYHFILGGIYGLGGGQNKNGYYAPTVDLENGTMTLASMYTGATVYLEYISDGSVTDGLTVIHPYAAEALLAWTYWRSIHKNRSIAQSERQAAKADYFRERRVARARLKSFTKEEALQQFRKGFKQSPKL
jgi:hypothetical protein